MKYIILVLSILFFTACSPKYRVVKEYHPPKMTDSAQTSVCLGLCESKRNACKDRCKEAFSSCKVKAKRIAQERYAKKMQAYTTKLENYVDNIDPFEGNMRFFYSGYYGYPFYYPPYYG